MLCRAVGDRSLSSFVTHRLPPGFDFLCISVERDRGSPHRSKACAVPVVDVVHKTGAFLPGLGTQAIYLSC